ncbi:hypothetical protein JHK87_027210 [Glycine soja]|nr:hypothetical protein JHK87_027210 [Glycine soja]
MEIIYDNNSFNETLPPFDKWKIVEARGIPNCGQSENSALWVLEWMQMEEFFVNSFFGVASRITTIINPLCNLLKGQRSQEIA